MSFKDLLAEITTIGELALALDDMIETFEVLSDDFASPEYYKALDYLREASDVLGRYHARKGLSD